MAWWSKDDDLQPRKPRKAVDAETKKKHAAALNGFKASASFFAEQRKREVEDLKFVDFDEQWDPTAKVQRAGNQAVNGLPPTPPRPAVVINQLRAPCQQVANTRRNARLGLQFAPKGAGATQAIAEVYEDIARAIQTESRASIARNWAADRAEKCGTGWYRIDTEYAKETPDDEASWNDQEIVYRRILNQASVYPDPHAQEPDFSDGKRWYVTQDLPFDVYKAEYPDSDLADYDSGELTAIGDAQPKWVFTSATGEDGAESQPTVRIAECWEVVETERTRVMLTDGTSAFEDDIPDDKQIATGPQARSRRVRDRQVLWSKINAVEYLEPPRPWNGAYVPLIPCIGEESNVNGERRWIGIVRPGRDAAASYNVMRSAQIEAISLGTKAPYIGFMETIEPYLEWWKQSAVRNFIILPVKAAYDKAGNLLPIPKRTVEEPAIQAMTIAAAAAKDDIHATTGIPPVALGQLDPHDRSGKAIQALQGQAEVGSSGYLDNFVQISMAYEGKVIRDLIPRIYDRPGRIVPAVGVDEKRRMVMLNFPFVEGPDGVPVGLQHWQVGMPVPPSIQGPDGRPLEVHYYNLADGEVSVAPVVGKSYATRREEAGAAISNVLQVVPPEMAAAIAPAWLEEQDFPGAKKIAEIAKKALPPQLAAAYQDEDAGPNQEVVALQQQLAQAKQMIESGAAQEQAKQQAETQRDLAKAQMDAQTALQKAQIDAQVRIEVARINAQAGLTEASIKAGLDTTGHQIDREEAMIGRDRDLLMQARDHQHEREMADVQHQQALEQADQGAVIASQQAEQQAALQPPQNA